MWRSKWPPTRPWPAPGGEIAPDCCARQVSEKSATVTSPRREAGANG